MDHSRRWIVFVIVVLAILGYLALDRLLAPPRPIPGPAAPPVSPAGP